MGESKRLMLPGIKDWQVPMLIDRFFLLRIFSKFHFTVNQYNETTDTTAGFTLLVSVTKPDTTYTHTGLTNGTTYYYKITAVDSAGNESGYSDVVSATPANSLTVNLLAYYSFDKGTVDDISGNGRDGDLNTAKASYGLVGNGLYFDGKSYANLPDYTHWTDITYDFTISAWVLGYNYPPDNYSVIPVELDQSASGVQSWNTGIAVSYNNKGQVGVFTGEGKYDSNNLRGVGSNTNTFVIDYRWHHIVAVKSGNNRYVYLDNKLVAQSSNYYGLPILWNDLAYSYGTASLGARVDGTNLVSESCLKGYLDEVAVWNRALDSTEISRLYNSGLGYNPLTGESGDPHKVPPLPPQNLTALAGNQQVTLTWSPNTESDLEKYNIYETTDTNAGFNLLASVNKPDTTYTHTGLTNGTTYYYKITAVDSAGNESGYSDVVSASPNNFQWDYQDNFNNLDNWEILSGTWTASDNVLSGYWSISSANGSVGNIKLKSSAFSAKNFEAEFEFTFGGKQGTYGSAIAWPAVISDINNKIMCVSGYSNWNFNGESLDSISYNFKKRISGTTTSIKADWKQISWNPSQWNKVRFARFNDVYYLFFNDRFIDSVKISDLSNVNNFGFVLYGNSKYRNFKIREINNSPMLPSCNTFIAVNTSEISSSELQTLLNNDGISSQFECSYHYAYKITVNGGGGYYTHTDIAVCFDGVTPVDGFVKGVSDDTDSEDRTQIGIYGEDTLAFCSQGWVNASGYIESPELIMTLDSRWGSNIDTYIYFWFVTNEPIGTLGYVLLDNHNDDFGSISIEGYNIIGQINNDLVAYYPFNGNANDESGNGHNGIVNGATLTSDRFGNANSAYSFDGVNDYINLGKVATNILPNNTDVRSISIWTYQNSSTGDNTLISYANNDYYSEPYYFDIQTLDGNTIRIYTASFQPGNTFNNKYVQFTHNKNLLNSWANYIFIFNGDKTISLWINGEFIEKSAPIPNWSPISSNYDVWIGKSWQTYGDQYFHGLLDDIRVYDKALSSTEIDSLYHENGWTGNPLTIPRNLTATPGNQQITLTWSPNTESNLEKYNIYETTDTTAGFTLLASVNKPDTTYTHTGLTNWITYYYKITAVDSAGNESGFSSVVSAMPYTLAHDIIALYPSNNAVNIPVDVTFRWLKGRDDARAIRENQTDRVITTTKIQKKWKGVFPIKTISYYWFELTKDTMQASMLIDSTLTDTTKHVEGLEHLTNYWWRVRAKNEAGWGEFTEWSKFTTIVDVPSIVQLISPVDSLYYDSTMSQPEFIWHSEPLSDYYKLQLSYQSDFGTQFFAMDSIVDTSFTPSVQFTGDFYWRVRGENIAGYGEWSTPNFVRVIITDINEKGQNIPKSYSLFQNYPNPFNPTTVINYGLPKSSFVKLVIYDVVGHKVKTLVNKTQPAGSYNVTFDASNLSSGIYFYRLTAGNFISTKKMILLK